MVSNIAKHLFIYSASHDLHAYIVLSMALFKLCWMLNHSLLYISILNHVMINWAFKQVTKKVKYPHILHSLIIIFYLYFSCLQRRKCYTYK